MGNLYHIVNRGVEQRKIFLDDRDYLRFAHNLFDFNDRYSAPSYFLRRPATNERPREQKREAIVDVLAWSLLPNHAHILVAERVDRGVSLFSKKIIGGYTKYFNQRYDRVGVLFQGRSKIIPVEREAHFSYLPFYVHLNPLDTFESGWRQNGVKDVRAALLFLDSYRWSNYRDIVDEGEFPEITNRDLFLDFFGSAGNEYYVEIKSWLSEFGGWGSDEEMPVFLSKKVKKAIDYGRRTSVD